MNFEFNDKIHYNQETAKSVYDKLGFVNRIYENIDLIVDFGCADGTVTRFIKIFYPNTKIIGYDYGNNNNVDDMIEYISDSTKVIELVNEYSSKGLRSLLIMNSVHHEIFNYMEKDQYYMLLNNLYNVGFTYIFIRDLNIKVSDNPKFKDIIPVELAKLPTKIKQLGYNDQFNQFLEIYNNGELLNPMTIEGQKQYIHFLLKCRYKEKEDWNFEVKENYLAHDDKFPIDGLFLSTDKRYPYHMTDSRSYVLPYVNYINNKEFGIDLKHLGITTHSQSLYKRNFEKK